MRQTLINFLTYCIERLRNGECTEEELESAYREVVTHIDVRGTCDDFARFYGQPKTNIRNVLSRRYIPETQKPKLQTCNRLKIKRLQVWQICVSVYLRFFCFWASSLVLPGYRFFHCADSRERSHLPHAFCPRGYLSGIYRQTSFEYGA